MAEILEREGYKVKLKVEVPAAEVSRAYQSLLDNYSRRVKLPGFRPGKTPTRVLEAKLGSESLWDEVKERLVDDSFPKAAKELGLTPVGARVLEADLEAGKPFVYVAELENYPEVSLPNWREFKLEVEKPEVTDEMVSQAIEDLRERHGELAPVERPIEPKDHVLIETEEDGQVPVQLESAHEHVRDALVGKIAGDVIMIPLKDGEQLVREVKAKVLEVKTLQLPELDEEFAKTVGEESLLSLRNKVRTSLEVQVNRLERDRKADQLVEKLAEGLKNAGSGELSQADIAPSMLAEEERHLLSHLAEDLQKQKITLDEYLKTLESQGKLEEFKTELRGSAEKRLRRSLAREKLAEELGTTYSDEEWKAYLADLARAYRTNPVKLQQDLGGEALARMREQRLRDKAVFEAVDQLSQ